MTMDENWAIPAERVRQFFSQQPDVVRAGEGFAYRDCRILLTPLRGQPLGQWELPRTHIQIEGGGEAVREIYRRFFLRFLSAGG